MQKPELLAPAGNREAFEAALAAGADAVYLGVEDGFNARCNADNFHRDELEAVCRDAHLRRAKVYLTANTLVFPGEMEQVLRMVLAAAEAGVDATIVQDMGLAARLRNEVPELELHTSTQMNIRDEAGIEFARKLGFGRVTLARELSLERIAQLAQLDMPLECFVHGALCICQSGQCFMSSLIGGRSANRGVCAQPCRLPYQLVNEEGRCLGDPGDYLLSPKDLQAIDLLPRLVEAGVASLKIEGRMKGAEYVSAVTHAYRSALDRACEEPQDFVVTEEEKSALAEAFSRGFTTAYLTGERGNAMMGYQRPNNRGVTVGRIAGFRNGMVRVDATVPLQVGDLLEIWTSKGRVAYEVMQADDLRPGKVELYIRGAVSVGDRVFRVRSAALKQQVAQRTVEGFNNIPLRVGVCAVEGEPLMCIVADEQGAIGQASGAVIEAARTKALTREEIIEHVGRLGGTPYTVSEWDIELSESAGAGFSALHKVRAEALADYERAVLEEQRYERRERGRACSVPQLNVVTQGEKMASFATQIDFGGATDVARTVSEFAPGKAIGPKLYATNADALRAWAALGANFAWLSPELTLAQIKQLADESPLPLGLVVYGNQELMVSDHCFLAAEGPCNQKCATCKRRSGARRYYRDRKGYRFPVTADDAGRGHLYNAVCLDVVHAIPDLQRAGVRGFAVDTTLLSEQDAEQEYYRIRRAMQGKPVRKEDGGTTAGNLFRNRTGAKASKKQAREERYGERRDRVFNGNRVDTPEQLEASRERRAEHERREARQQARAVAKGKKGIAGAKAATRNARAAAKRGTGNERTGGSRTDDNRTGGNRVGGNRGDGNRARAARSGGNGGRSGGNRSGGYRAGGNRSGGRAGNRGGKRR